ncbi:LOW QUALITY PROTEIN: TRAF-type zinc finger domain-containing protein 1 [Myiozetetes cayanensis]|uniref:LOW QUALITY PROTEIN: TRAF-type zinc finger domain-containing protein 1 n=1 Tax=Myiozetetes cayanensis TaxID=478635 RepID=UPI0021604770|nr:LOW QUALITY PROTEIN: TRAF-type zinc finger domain-containing protein 1 [Myiozetetes cayanensis]
MAIAAVPGAESRLCGNCKKDIPAVNFLIHEIHCRRNIEICPYCSDSIPKSEMKNHIESEHVQVTCKCRMKIENSLLKDHEESSCPLRPALCQFCDIPLAFNKLREHESYCGARTEPCRDCGRNVLLRDLREHPRLCGRQEESRGSRAAPGVGRERNPEGAAQLRELGARREQERSEIPHSSLPEEWNAELDYALALSLQNENNPHPDTAAGIPREFWEYDYAKEAGSAAHLSEAQQSNTFSCDSPGSFSTSDHRKNMETIMLPCEFCEELCPAEELILHQTGCNPASAFASFSKRSSSPNPWDYDGLCAVGSNSWSTLPSSQPQAVQAQGNIMIPCEFCGIQLEEEILFHHQHHCDLRPASPAAAAPALERRESPEPARRRSRRQGDVSPRHTEGFGQAGLGCPARGTKLRSDVANARNTPLSRPGAADAPNAQGKPRKGNGSQGRPKDRGTGEAAGGTPPRARPAQHFRGETFTSSFSRASPAQPSPSTGGRSLGLQDGRVGLRRGSSKAKAQSPGARSPEE